jgi:hypothetical protein
MVAFGGVLKVFGLGLNKEAIDLWCADDEREEYSNLDGMRAPYLYLT